MFILYSILATVAGFVFLIWYDGFSLAFGLMGAIALHELGHWCCFRYLGLPARILVTPLFGLVIGKLDADGRLPMTPYQHGWLLLSGALWSILPVFGLLALGLERYDSILYLCFILTLINLLNLLIWLPITDGGRIVLLLVGNWRGRHVAAWGALLGGGALLPLVADWWWTIGLMALSIWLLPMLAEFYGKEDQQLCRAGRVKLGVLFLLTVALNGFALWWCTGDIFWISDIVY